MNVNEQKLREMLGAVGEMICPDPVTNEACDHKQTCTECWMNYLKEQIW